MNAPMFLNKQIEIEYSFQFLLLTVLITVCMLVEIAQTMLERYLVSVGQSTFVAAMPPHLVAVPIVFAFVPWFACGMGALVDCAFRVCAT